MTGEGYGRLSITPRLRHEVLEDGDASCFYCGQWSATEVEHVVPVVAGGLTVRSNLVAACELCNLEKGGRTPGAWRSWREERGMPWPPEGRVYVILPLIATLDEQTQRTVLAAFEKRDPTWHEWYAAWSRRVHRGEQGEPAHEARLMLDAIR